MHLENLSLLNFKNYEELNLQFNPGINVFVGRNGSGKTNLLDAIYFLALTKSAFATYDQQCIRNREAFCMVKGTFDSGDRKSEISGYIQSGGKKVIRENQREYEKISDHIGKVPLVLIAPDDTDLVREGSELRRKFFDGIICQLDKAYLESLLRYNAALKNRNSLLKMFAESGRTDYLALESYDRILVEAGSYIYNKRNLFMASYQPVFKQHYDYMANTSEEVGLRYASAVHNEEFGAGLLGSRQKDLILQRTSFGIHRDDYEFAMAEGDLKRFGSQGQQKTFVIALKLAQFQILESEKARRPILLLDDVFDKLDDERITRLLSLINERFGQLFITDARPHRTEGLLAEISSQVSVFEVENGKIMQQRVV